MKAINYRNATKIRLRNKRVTVLDRKDEKGFMLQFAKMNDASENEMFFATSEVVRGVRYTTLSLTDDAVVALYHACENSLKRKLKAHLEMKG